jgi:hypothetical protein
MRNGFVAGQAQASTYALGRSYFHSPPSYLDEEETMKHKVVVAALRAPTLVEFFRKQ